MSIHATVGKKDSVIKVISIEGHAESQDKGKQYQLVCAGVSAISYGLLNSIDELTGESCEITVNSTEDASTNHITIVVKNDSKELQLILQVGEIQLKTIAENNKKYFDLKITEV